MRTEGATAFSDSRADPVEGGRRYTLQDPRLQARYRKVGFVTFGLPALGALVALGWAVARGGVSTQALFVAIAMYFLSVLGLEVGYHRHFTHKAFDARPAVRVALGALGATGVSGPLLYWIATHRLHHAKSDGEEDPHSPRNEPGRLRGMWHAQIGWMLGARAISNPIALAPDALRDRVVMAVTRLYIPFALAGLLIPALIGAYSAGMAGAVEGLLWGGLLRLFLVQTLFTGALNSVCHSFGSQEFATADDSRNNAWLALPTLGESWHNNHHAFPSAAVLRMRWYQIDISGAAVIGLSALGLASNARIPSAEARARKRRGAPRDIRTEGEEPWKPK